MITVFCLSPAVDVTYELDQLRPGQSQRVTRVHRLPGGKGVNVARILHQANVPVKLVLPLGGLSGTWIANELLASGIDLVAVGIEAQSRTCVAITAAEVTVLNEPAAAISQAEFDQLLELAGNQTEIAILSGSVPQSLTEQQLAKLLSDLRRNSDYLIVDSSGSILNLAASIQADLLKPNLEEALAATKTASAEAALSQLLSLGAKQVLLSNGAAHAVFAIESRRLRAVPMNVEGNATGAGDAMVAAIAYSRTQAFTPEQTLSRAVAAGSLAVVEPTAGQIDWSKLESTAAAIEIEE